jgi:hypothetical protein
MFDNHTEITLPKYPGTVDEFGYCDRFTVTGRQDGLVRL